MIVSFHVATGGAGGMLVRSRIGAVALGALLHYLADRVPHQDVASHRFETVTGTAGILGLALRHGPLDPVTVGAVASSLPDVEHAVRLPRPGGRKLFPSHRFGAQRPGGVPTWAQLLVAGAVLGTLLGGVRRRETASGSGD